MKSRGKTGRTVLIKTGWDMYQTRILSTLRLQRWFYTFFIFRGCAPALVVQELWFRDSKCTLALTCGPQLSKPNPTGPGGECWWRQHQPHADTSQSWLQRDCSAPVEISLSSLEVPKFHFRGPVWTIQLGFIGSVILLDFFFFFGRGGDGSSFWFGFLFSSRVSCAQIV